MRKGIASYFKFQPERAFEFIDTTITLSCPNVHIYLDKKFGVTGIGDWGHFDKLSASLGIGLEK
ncbi:MAG: hypothetical protein HEQ35_28310 [Gloeotrichia echinulata IR180]